MKPNQLALVDTLFPLGQHKAWIEREAQAKMTIFVEEGALGQKVLRIAPIWWKIDRTWQKIMEEGSMILSYPSGVKQDEPAGFCTENQLNPKPFLWTSSTPLLQNTENAIYKAATSSPRSIWIELYNYEGTSFFYNRYTPMIRKSVSSNKGEVKIIGVQAQAWYTDLGMVNIHVGFGIITEAKNQSLDNHFVAFHGITRRRTW